MSRIKEYFMERFETDPAFREAVELAEWALCEPDYAGGEASEPESQEPQESGEQRAA